MELGGCLVNHVCTPKRANVAWDLKEPKLSGTMRSWKDLKEH